MLLMDVRAALRLEEHGEGWVLVGGSAARFGLVGVPGVSRIGDLLVSQAAEWFRYHSCSASLGVRYPNAEWSRF